MIPTNVLTNPPRLLRKRTLCYLFGEEMYSETTLEPKTYKLPALISQQHLNKLGITRMEFARIRLFSTEQTKALLELQCFTNEDVERMRTLEKQYRILRAKRTRKKYKKPKR